MCTIARLPVDALSIRDAMLCARQSTATPDKYSLLIGLDCAGAEYGLDLRTDRAGILALAAAFRWFALACERLAHAPLGSTVASHTFGTVLDDTKLVATMRAGSMLKFDEADTIPPCQCEHERHGLDGCSEPATTTAATIYGPFKVCAGCTKCMTLADGGGA